ncbi:LrgB family protein [Proteiniclasticum sp. BAD-10]|uniref:LrgB family protein n=1 Tax=Proteiniclasticum sediminis TaxID=2804028 RepID=A0A941CTV6_9CLOT|nr:LrgB family protein [Proteiniclasticum sediminis]MBR0577311.1 LrgB family protein [Proteiniclasticum sediminis]
MKALLDTPLFGILLSVLAYEAGILIQRKYRKPYLNPLLLAILFVIGILLLFHLPKESYDKGGSFILFFLGPATVVLAIPLYRQMELLKKDLVPILTGILVGSTTSVLSVIFFSKVFRVDLQVAVSMLPKSVTTAIGMEVSKQIGGIVSLSVAVIVLTGIMGAVLGPALLKLFRIKDPVAQGVAIGTASHAVGTSKAMELGETQGAMSGLSIGLAGLATVILVPLLMRLL